MNNNSMFEHRRPDHEWADINSGDEWKRAYQPYSDEPLRPNGFSVTSDASSSDGLTVLDRRVNTSNTLTRHWVAAT